MGFAGYDAKDYSFPYVQIKNGKVEFYPETENYYNYLQYLNKLYANGLVDPNGFIQEEVDMIAKGTGTTSWEYFLIIHMVILQ